MSSPSPGPDLSSRPDPAVDYAAASARIDHVLDAEGSSTAPLVAEGGSIALLHGHATARCVVLFHGYTSMPGQFALLAEAYDAAGYNVLVPRMPFHGYVDRMTRDISCLTASMLRDHADTAIDIAAGLGEEVTVVGLSGGGSLAVWAAVARVEVTETVAISPLMQPSGWSPAVTKGLVAVLPYSPDVYLWWAPSDKERLAGYGYPRFTLKGIGAFLSLVYWIEAVAEREPFPVRGRFTLVRNDGDQRLDGAFNEALVRALVPSERLTIYTIPASASLLHDVVTPEPEGENAELIDDAYRRLSEALDIELPQPTLRRPAAGAVTA